MADKSHNQTDKLLEQMEKRISAIYAEAQVEMKKKAEAYFDAFIAEGDRKLKLVKAGKLSEAEYQKWVKNKIAYGKRFDQFKQQYAEAMSHVNEIAAAYINDQLPDIYALNYNGAGEDIASQVGGYSFTMADASTVKNLATRDTTLLPYKYIDGKKDVRWNTQKVNAAITQGIVQGESIPNIAKRLSQNIPEMNKASAIRNARTATTGAECAGRQSQYEDATRRGIQLQREWIAAIDMRTRHAHRLLDGQLADVDKPFESELGDIMFPGDPEAHPANVYNCRCTTAARVIGIGKTQVNERLEKADRETAQDFYNKDPKAFDIGQKMLYNEKADKDQYKKYKARLHGEVPRSFAAFQNMKYHESDKYNDLVKYYRYKGRVPEATRNDFEIAKRIKEKGIVGTIRVPAAKIDISNLSAVNDHAFRHGCTLEDAKSYIENAKVSIGRQRWDGYSINFYSEDGAAYVDPASSKVKTIFGKENYDPKTKEMMEVFE